ncbi:MAG TPA: nucleotide pyrophosphohydrolase [Candidatus Saccharimonadales bacterium]
MSTSDNDTTLKELKDLIHQFAEERNWKKHHTPKNLAISIAIEAAELLEHFQWDEYQEANKQQIADELADVLIYAFNFANEMDIDIASTYKQKLTKAVEKYPVGTFNKNSDSREEYFRIKKAYRQGKESAE